MGRSQVLIDEVFPHTVITLVPSIFSRIFSRTKEVEAATVLPDPVLRPFPYAGIFLFELSVQRSSQGGTIVEKIFIAPSQSLYIRGRFRRERRVRCFRCGGIDLRED